MQETYVRAWRAFDRFEGRSSVTRYEPGCIASPPTCA
ncbi:MAG: hypothetical protein ACLP0J_09050 [Solirubrobacteraceae bacterium]